MNAQAYCELGVNWSKYIKKSSIKIVCGLTADNKANDVIVSTFPFTFTWIFPPVSATKSPPPPPTPEPQVP